MALDVACGKPLGSLKLFLLFLTYHCFVFFSLHKELFFNYFLAIGVGTDIFGVDNGTHPSVHLNNFFPGFRGDTGLSAACASIAHYTPNYTIKWAKKQKRDWLTLDNLGVTWVD